MKKIFLKKGRDEAVKRQHPWIFSGAVAHTEGVLEDGDLVEIYDSKKQWLAIGYYNDGSIVIRVLSFEPTSIDAVFWSKKLENAYQYRQKLELTDSKSTNCYRLIHAEGDGLPGLIVDIYGSVAVVQCHSIGMHLQVEAIKKGLQKVFGEKLTAIYDKSVETLPAPYIAQNNIKNGYLFGEAEVPLTIFENDNAFAVDWITGQKTGFFLDQRDNRALLSRYAKGKSVLNAFCYSGGFSVYALKAGAKSVHSIDISPKAIDLTLTNVEINRPFTGEHTAAAVDVLAFLKENERIFDVMIVDPPAFAKSINKIGRAHV